MRIIYDRLVVCQFAFIFPAWLQFAFSGIINESLEHMVRILRTLGVHIVLDAINLDSLVRTRETLEILPYLLVDLQGINHPIFEDELRRVRVRHYS